MIRTIQGIGRKEKYEKKTENEKSNEGFNIMLHNPYNYFQVKDSDLMECAVKNEISLKTAAKFSNKYGNNSILTKSAIIANMNDERMLKKKIILRDSIEKIEHKKDLIIYGDVLRDINAQGLHRNMRMSEESVGYPGYNGKVVYNKKTKKYIKDLKRYKEHDKGLYGPQSEILEDEECDLDSNYYNDTSNYDAILNEKYNNYIKNKKTEEQECLDKINLLQPIDGLQICDTITATNATNTATVPINNSNNDDAPSSPPSPPVEPPPPSNPLLLTALL